ncbi:MAG: hypothetical protein HUJ31_07155 [Pseudomonadales bacterium]|nr:hypothetical protein [Pseudomonadales bacterium]
MKPGSARLVLIVTVVLLVGLLLAYRLLTVSTAPGWQHAVYLENLPGVSALAPIGNTLYVTLEHTQYRGAILAFEEGRRRLVIDSLQKPDGATVHGDKLIYTQEWGFYPVYEFDGERHRALFPTAAAEGVTVMDNGDVYTIEDRPGGRLLKYSRQDESVTVIEDNLEEGEGVCVMTNGDIYYTEKGQGNVYRLRNGHKTIFLTDLANPGFLRCRDPDDSIWITEDRQNFGRLVKADTEGNLEIIATGLSAPQSVVFLDDGSMLLAEQGRSRILRLQRQR